MKTKKNLLYSFVTVLSLYPGLVTAQLNNTPGDKFTPYGKPVFLVFGNMHSSFNTEGSNKAFELTRVYLGYEYFFSKNLSSRVNIDVGDPRSGDLQMTAYIKNAYLQYKAEKFSGRIGMIGTDQYNLIEKQWGYRYIFKTFQDEYAFGPSADLGAAAEYSPSKVISFDASVLNGEGYKKLQSDSAFKYTFGVTLRLLEGLTLRAYTDYMKNDYAQNSVSFFAGYSIKGLKTGVEYNIQKNNKMLNDHDFSGISAWASLKFAEKYSLFARYDNLKSVKLIGATNAWNYGKDGQLFLAGLDYSPVAGIKIAPVYLGWLPADASEKFTSTIGLYFEIRL
jgi:hypothetical protein